jgi:hypothetical protein
MFDVIIIGGGIAGLYSAYKMKELDPSVNLLLVEAEDHLGGRAGNYNFHGQSVPIGAGVGRKKKDKLLIKLLDKLKIKYRNFMASSQYANSINPVCNLKEMFLYLKNEYSNDKDRKKTFKQYAKPKLEEKYGVNSYKYFTICSGYTDYEKESAYDTIYDYGFDDNYSDWPAMAFSWNELVELLASNVGHRNIKKSCCVKKLIKNADGNYSVLCNKENFSCKNIIIATTIDSVLDLLPNNGIYKQIKGQEFLRVYGKFSKESMQVMNEYCPKTTIVSGPLHKIIPMNAEKGIYMIAYTDNQGARDLEKYKKNTKKNRDVLCRLLEIALEITPNTLELEDMVDFYWEIGTHYFTPLKGNFKNRKEYCDIAQCPEENIRVVGELISMNQGWVEGALESVDNVIDINWSKKLKRN